MGFKEWATDDGFGERSKSTATERKMPNHVLWFLATVALFFIWLPLAVISLIIWIAISLAYVQRGTEKTEDQGEQGPPIPK